MRFVRQPSPATVIASIALFVSLGGVSYGLATGSIDSREIKNNDVRTQDIRNGQVTTDDIRFGHVRTRDILNNDVRGVDVRTGTLHGSDVADNSLQGLDINESTLGTVPSASRAGSANTASFATNATNATNATRASSAAAVDRVSVSGTARANYADPPVTVVSAGAWRIELDCDANSSEVNLVNVSAGNDAHFHSGFNGTDLNYDQGDSELIVSNLADLEQFVRTTYGAQGPSGARASGDASLSEDPNGNFDLADCVASATLFGS